MAAPSERESRDHAFPTGPRVARLLDRDAIMSRQAVGPGDPPDQGTTIPARRPSLQDVAKLAGVSAAAVSYVVNGRKGEVSAKTLLGIEAAIAALGYRPQRRGLTLKLNREFAIGLVVVDPNPNFLADPFTNQVATGLSNALAEPGYGLTVTGCLSVEMLGPLLTRPIGVDAYVVVASGPPDARSEAYHLLGNVRLPVVIVQDGAQDGIGDCCAIMQDDHGGACLLTRHLLDRGAKRFLLVAPSRAWPAIERREAGIVAALPEGCSFHNVECNEHDFTGTAAAIDHALDRLELPDAVMGANDQIAIAALRVLHRRGIDVPRDVQVTGYNDFAFRGYVTPLLTTIASSALDIGRSCARTILARLDTGSFGDRTVVLPVTLDVGGTTRAG